MVPARGSLLALGQFSDWFRLDVGGVGVVGAGWSGVLADRIDSGVDVIGRGLDGGVAGAGWLDKIDRSDVLDWVDFVKRGDLTGSGLDLVVIGVGNVGKEKDFGGDEDDRSAGMGASIAGMGADLALNLDVGDPDLSFLGVENGFDLDESLTGFGFGLDSIAGLEVVTVVFGRFLATIGGSEGLGITGLAVLRIMGLGAIAIGGDGAGTGATASTGATSTISIGSTGGTGDRHHSEMPQINPRWRITEPLKPRASIVRSWRSGFGRSISGCSGLRELDERIHFRN